MLSVVSLLAATLAFQAPRALETATGVTPPPQEAAKPSPPITPEMRGDIMMARKMYREAIDFYKTGANADAVMANKTGIAYQQLLDLDNARKYYERAIKLNPKYAEAVNNLGTVYFERKSYRRAVEQYKKALRLMPNSASFLINLGTAHFMRKNYDEASKAYQAAIALDPDVLERRGTQGTTVQDQSIEERAKWHYYVAKSYAKEGNKDRAIEYIRKALEEGFKDREKFLKEPEFAALQDDPEFKQIIATEQKVL